MHYDTLILGGGPIGASTAYFLAQQKTGSIGLITKEPADDHSAAYTNAGGSVRWFWENDLKIQMTKETADFIKQRVKDGVELDVIEDRYIFMHRGINVPSLNVSGKKLVKYLLDEAAKADVEVKEQETVVSVEHKDDKWTVKTDKTTYTATKVLLALGTANTRFLTGYELDIEKRELFVLDLPVSEDQTSFPHVIFPLGDGVVYVFLKRTPSGLRFVVGQEDVVEQSDDAVAEDYFQKLLDAGLGELMPFLKDAKVETIWWGFDAGNKTLKIVEQDGLMAVNCGSAARSCAWIGRTLAEKLSA